MDDDIRCRQGPVAYDLLEEFSHGYMGPSSALMGRHEILMTPNLLKDI